MKPAAPVTNTFNAVLQLRVSQTRVGSFLRQDVLDVEDHYVWATERADSLRSQRHELPMRNRDHDRVVGTAFGIRDDSDSVLVLRFARVGPWIVNIDTATMSGEVNLPTKTIGSQMASP